jgi:hypothetical protein
MDDFTRCAVCSRTLLIGERVTVVSGPQRESPVCELCLERPRAAELGEPQRRERIRSAAGTENVQRLRPVPAEAPAPPEPAAV